MKRFKPVFLPAVIFFILGSALAGCRAPAANPPEAATNPVVAIETAVPTPIMPPALQGDLEVQQLMLNSAGNWQNLHATYRSESYPSGGSFSNPVVQIHEIWIRLPAEFKVYTSATQGQPEGLRVSDGKAILDNQGNRSELPASVFEPFSPPTAPSDTVVLHPLAGLLGTPVSDLIFPAGLAQRGGEYRVTGKEILAGRDAVVAEWGREPGEVIDRFWVDEQTGIVLRQQNYGKENSLTPLTDIQATLIVLDEEISGETFDLAQVAAYTPEAPPAGASAAYVIILPEVMNVRSGPGVDYKVITTVLSGAELPVIGRRDANDWYKVVVDGQEGWVSSLYVELNGDLEEVPVVNY